MAEQVKTVLYVAKERLDNVAETAQKVSQRLHMNEPVILSRCSLFPLLILLIQAIVIAFLSSRKEGLSTFGGIFQLVLSLLCLAFLTLQLEGLEIRAQTHNPNMFAVQNLHNTRGQGLGGEDDEDPTSSLHHHHTCRTIDPYTGTERIDDMLPH